jgi:hypothetical protein
MKMEMIWKYQIYSTEEQKLEMPWGSELLDIQIQNGEPYIWARVNPENRTIKREVYVIGTGHAHSEIKGQYVGTFQQQDGELVFHVFVD